MAYASSCVHHHKQACAYQRLPCLCGPYLQLALVCADACDEAVARFFKLGALSTHQLGQQLLLQALLMVW